MRNKTPGAWRRQWVFRGMREICSPSVKGIMRFVYYEIFHPQERFFVAGLVEQDHQHHSLRSILSVSSASTRSMTSSHMGEFKTPIRSRNIKKPRLSTFSLHCSRRVNTRMALSIGAPSRPEIVLICNKCPCSQSIARATCSSSNPAIRKSAISASRSPTMSISSSTPCSNK